MNYQNINTNEIKAYQQIIKANPSISFPKEGAEMVLDVWKRITKVSKPDYDKLTEECVELPPVNYTQTWEVRDLPADVSLRKRTAEWKALRNEALDNIDVTYKGIVYEGDELSQSRMTRAIVMLNDDISIIEWTAKDDTQHGLNRKDLKTILSNAFLQQTLLWNKNRPV